MIVDIILPSFSIILIGKLLRWSNLITDAFIKSSYKILDNWLLPLLIFWTIAQPAQFNNDTLNLTIVLTLACALTYVLVYLFIYFSNVQAHDAALLAQGSFRFNIYICLAIMIGYDQTTLRDLCLFIGFALPAMDLLTTIHFDMRSKQAFTKSNLMRIVFDATILNPLLIATILGLISSTVIAHWPLFISKLFAFVIPAVVPLALILIGGTLSFEFLRKPHLLPLISSIFKFVVLPTIGYFCIRLFPIDGSTAKIVIITLVLPCSVTFSSNSGSTISRIIEYNSVSTLFSFAFLSAIVILM